MMQLLKSRDYSEEEQEDIFRSIKSRSAIFTYAKEQGIKVEE